MAIAYACMLIAAALPYFWIFLTKVRVQVGGESRNYNNHAPRAQQAKLEGWRQRAVWAQNNAFESMPAFLAGVLAAGQAGVPAEQVNAAAEVFIAGRILHGVFYLANLPLPRSSAWLVGLIATVYLFVLAVRH